MFARIVIAGKAVTEVPKVTGVYGVTALGRRLKFVCIV
jgi:hypothetical protein